MSDSWYFFTVFGVTVLVVRIFLYIHPVPSPKIGGLRTHHYMYGLLLALIAAALGNITLYAIGMGLFVDELGFVLIGGQTHEANYSKASLSLLVLFVILVGLCREWLIYWF